MSATSMSVEAALTLVSAGRSVRHDVNVSRTLMTKNHLLPVLRVLYRSSVGQHNPHRLAQTTESMAKTVVRLVGPNMRFKD